MNQDQNYWINNLNQKAKLNESIIARQVKMIQELNKKLKGYDKARALIDKLKQTNQEYYDIISKLGDPRIPTPWYTAIRAEVTQREIEEDFKEFVML